MFFDAPLSMQYAHLHLFYIQMKKENFFKLTEPFIRFTLKTRSNVLEKHYNDLLSNSYFCLASFSCNSK
jgi:hypothetical protein